MARMSSEEHRVIAALEQYQARRTKPAPPSARDVEVQMKKKNYRMDTSQSADPPEEIGTNLVSLVRGNDILRATWTTYEGHPYLSLRIWTPAKDGPGYWPTRRGISIRRHELAEIRAALDAAIQLAERFENDAA
mgnify:FL=1